MTTAQFAVLYLIAMAISFAAACAWRAATHKHGLRLSDLPVHLLLAVVWPAAAAILALYAVTYAVVWPAEKIEAWFRRHDRTLLRLRKPRGDGKPEGGV